MKVLMVPSWLNVKGHEESGIKRVVEKYTIHGPSAGIEFVDPKSDSFDVLAVHAGMSKEFPIDVPFVAHLHGVYWTADYQAELWEYKVNRDVVDAIRHATTVTVPSAWVTEPFLRDLHLRPEILPHGIDVDEWQHSESNDGYVLWNKNRAEDVCDPAPVGELAKRFPLQLFQTTFGPRSLTPNIKVTGKMSHEKMKKAVQRASVYLATTKETGGIGILEAMAAGIPVLGFRHGGILDTVIHGTNGYLAKPNDYDDLARGLEYCLKHRDVLGANGRELAKQFTWQKVMEQLYGIYGATMERFSQPSTVSVVIPCFNYSHTLERAVDSAFGQADEIIIVDNNSTDNTAEVARHLIDKYSSGPPANWADAVRTRISYVNEPAQGVAHARNRGIGESTGKYIVCLDADDEIKPGFIKTCLNALRADPSLGLAYTKLEWVRQDGQRGVSEWPGEYNFDGFQKKQNQVPTCAMFRRDLFERLGGYRQRYAPNGAGAEDAEFWLRMGALGYRGQLVTKEPLFTYHLGGRVSSGNGYTEPDWLAGKPWIQDGQHPFASLATPKKYAHEVSQYDEPVVSVVIPCGPGHEKYLIDALDSLEAQSFRKWEAIVVFDGSVASPDLLTAFPFVRTVHTDGVGAGAARNAGAAIARGAFLLFLDADDWLRPTAIQRMLQAWQQEQAIIYGDYLGHAFIDDKHEIDKFRMRGRLHSYNERTKEAVITHQSFDYDCEEALRQPRIYRNGEYYIWSLISAMVPRRWHDEIGGFDESMKSWEDWDYWLRLARSGKCFYRITEPLLNYRFYSGTRRELASASTEDARQLRDSLLQYMTEKYKEQPAMPCGSCGKKRSQPPAAVQTPMMSPQMSSQMSADNIVWVRLNDGNLGQHPIIGVRTKTNYNYRSHGDLFKMMISDVQAAPHRFIVVQDPNAAPVATAAAPEQPAETPAPEHFTTWPEEKRRGRPKKVAA